MNDKLEQLYNLYKQNGIIQSTDFNTFSTADDNQKKKLYDLGKQKGLFKTTDYNTFSSAFSPVKKKEPTASLSPSGQKPTSSVTPAKKGQPQSVFLQDADTGGKLEILTGYPQKEDIEYNFDNGQWRKRKPGQTSWYNITNEGSISSLNKFFAKEKIPDNKKSVDQQVRDLEDLRELSDQETADALGWSLEDLQKANKGTKVNKVKTTGATVAPNIIEGKDAISVQANSIAKARIELGSSANQEKINDRAKYHENINLQKYLKNKGFDVDVNGDIESDKTKSALDKLKAIEELNEIEDANRSKFISKINSDITSDMLSSPESIDKLRSEFSKNGYVFESFGGSIAGLGVGPGRYIKVKYSLGNGTETREEVFDTSDPEASRNMRLFMSQTFMSKSEKEAITGDDIPTDEMGRFEYMSSLVGKMAANPSKYGRTLVSDEWISNHMKNTYRYLKDEQTGISLEYDNLKKRIDQFKLNPTEEERQLINNKVHEISVREIKLNGQYEKAKETEKNFSSISAAYATEMEKKGGFFTGLTAQFAKGVTSIPKMMLNISADILPYVVDAVDPITKARLKDDGYSDSQIADYASKQLKNTVVKDIEKGVVNIGSLGQTTEEYLQSEDRGVLENTLGFLANSIGTGLSGGGNGALTKLAFFSQSYNGMSDQMTGPEFDRLTETEKKYISVPYALVIGGLERLGFKFTTSTSKSPLLNKLINNTIAKTFSGIPKDASIQTINRAISESLTATMAQAGLRVVGGSIVEGAVEGSQQLAEISIKNLANGIIGKGEDGFDFFKDVPDITTAEGIKEALELASVDAAYGALGGSIMSTGENAVSSIKNYGIKKEQEKDFLTLRATLLDGNLRSLQDLDIERKLSYGEITQEEADEITNAMNNATSALGKIPDGLSTSRARESFGLLIERDKLEQEVKGKDENLVVAQKERIKEINNELQTISKDANKEGNIQEVDLEAKRQEASKEIDSLYTELKSKGLTNEQIVSDPSYQEALAKERELFLKINNPTTKESTSQIEDIEKRREEDLSTYNEEGLNETYAAGSDQTVGEFINAKYDAELAALGQPTTNQTVETLRAKEQVELAEAIPNIDEYKVDGEVDKNSMPADVLAKYNEIYDKYDKLITPLLTTAQEGQTVEQEITPESYVEELNNTIESDPETYWSVSPVDLETAKDSTIVGDSDGKGIVSKDGDIKGVFKSIGTKVKGVAEKILSAAVKVGGIKLDNFDGYLTKTYKKNGFRIVARVPFNEEFAPNGWNKEKHGTPDVVAMIYDPEGKLSIEEKSFTDYDEAMAYRDTFVEQARANKKASESVEQEVEAIGQLLSGTDQQIDQKAAKIANKKISKAVARAAKAISKIIPGTKFVVHDTNESFVLATGEGKTQDVGGIFDPKTNTIHINGTKANRRTVAHEVFHAILINKVKTDANAAAVTKRMVQAISAKIENNPALKKKLDDFVSNYEENIQNEEKLSELVGMLAENYNSLSGSIKDTIARWIDKLADLFGLDPFDRSETYDMLNTIAKKIAKGKEISEADVNIIKVIPSVTDKNGNLEKPSESSIKNLKNRRQNIVKETKDSVIEGPIVSTRLPKANDAYSNDKYIVSISDLENIASKDAGAESQYIKIAKEISGYNISKIKNVENIEDAKKVILDFKESIKLNLKWLYNSFGNDVRDISKLWYDGANKICNNISSDYNYSLEQVSGVMAVLSPQMDWFRNLSLGERVIDIYSKQQNSVFDSKMIEYVKNATSGTGKNKVPLFKDSQELISRVKNKKLSELNNKDKAYFIRVFDEVYNPREYNNISPNGLVNGLVRKKDGTPGACGWGAFPTIEKSISILQDGSIKNISSNLGNMHKVRNFFNNISNPNDVNAVTIDTHAVAAALLLPLSGSSKQVSYNFGGAGNVNTGMTGTYPVYADAYRELANELNLLPREVQSITWEAVRGLFKATFKSNKSNESNVNDIWNKYSNNEISLDDAHSQISNIAGGISKPVWFEYLADNNAKSLDSNSAAIDQANLDDEGDATVRKQLSPEVSNKLTEDKKGNFVFHHYSGARRNEIKPGTGENIITGKEESGALSAVGGLAMYYTMDNQVEPGVGNTLHTVLVPNGRIYDFNEDPDNFYGEAKKRFEAVRPSQSFSPNYQLAFVTQVANENGYDMIVARWRNNELRAQTTIPLKPSSENVRMKPIQEESFKVGDDVEVYGSKGKVVSIDGDVITFKGDGVSGEINFKRFPKNISKQITPRKQITKEVAGIEESMTERKQKVTSISDIVRITKDKGFSDAAIRQYLKDQGFSDKQSTDAINEYNVKKEGIFVRKDGGIPTKIVDSIRSFRRRMFSARSFLPKSVFTSRENKDASVARHLNIVDQNVKDFNRLYARYKGTKLEKEKLVEDFDAYIRGDKDVKLPEDFMAVANSMRNQIDGLSMQLISSGLVDAEMAQTIKDNLGQYLTRSYKIYDRANWKKEVENEVKQKAINLLKSQYREMAQEISNKEGIPLDEVLNNLVNNRLDEMLTTEGANNFITGSKLGSKDLSVLKERQDIPIEIRMLLGEYSDPALNYAKTVLKLSSLAANHKFLTEIKKTGMGVYFFEKNDPRRPADFNTMIAAEGSESMNPLNGLYTTKEIADAFMAQPSELGKVWKTFMKFQSAVRWLKTIGSVATHIKNVFGNIGFVWVNSHFDPKEVGRAFMTVKNDFSKGTNQQRRDKMNNYISLGIVKQSAGLGEIMDMFKDADWDTAMASRLSNQKLGLIGKAKRFFLQGKKKIEDAYQAEDDFFKIVAYENELSRYSKAMFKKDKSELTQDELAEVNKVVTEIVKNTYPTYDRIPEAIKMIRRAPFIGNFVSFQAESYRTAFNTIALAKNELASDNNKIKAIGAQRIWGSISYLAAKSAILSYFSMAAGTGLTGLAGYLFDNEDEEQKDKDIRKFVAPWSKNSDLLMISVGNGKMKYIDFSSSDPHGGMKKVMNAFFSGDTTVEAFSAGIVETFAPFIGEDMTVEALLALKNNKDKYGNPIYNTEESLYDQSEKVLSYMYKLVEPGTFSSIRRGWEAEDKTNELVANITGFRTYDVDINKQFGYAMKDYSARIKNAKNIYNSAYYNEKTTPSEKEKAYKKAQESLNGIYSEITDLYNSAERLGCNPKDLGITMDDFGNMSKRTVRDIKSGTLPELKKKD